MSSRAIAALSACVTAFTGVMVIRGCTYADPHHIDPTNTYPQTPDTDQSYPPQPPEINFGSAPAPWVGTACGPNGREKRDPGTGDWIVCRNGKWLAR